MSFAGDQPIKTEDRDARALARKIEPPGEYLS